MTCPKCGSKCYVDDTRHDNEHRSTYRLLRCSNENCGHKFYTMEIDVPTTGEFLNTWCKCDRWYKKRMQK